MRISLWIILFVVFYLHDTCVVSGDVSNGFQTTFQSVADFIKNVVSKSSSVASDIFGNHQNSVRKKFTRAFKHFKHNAWEEGEAKYLDATEIHNSTATYQLTISEVAKSHGYNIETHIVKTIDGYFLTTHRLTGVSNLRNRTVLLHHGLLGSSMDWILLKPGECMLPFTLAEAGYDVWFMNARGNIYSRSHATLTLSMPKFWDFSFEEMGLMDVPAIIDYIRRQNNVPIDFVAHSMGSTAFLVYLSSLPEYKKYLRTGVLIAPLAFMRNVTGPLLSVSEDTFKPRKGEFLPHRKVPRELASTYCKGPIKICRNPLFFLSGVPTQTSFTARVKDHVPAGGSVKTILHYMQLVKSGKFNSYKDKTHEYNMNSIDVPLALISSNNDELAIVKNVQKIYGLIKYPIAHYIIRNKNVSHTDLLWDKTASCLVIRKTLEYLVKGHKKINKTHESKEKYKNEDKVHGSDNLKDLSLNKAIEEEIAENSRSKNNIEEENKGTSQSEGTNYDDIDINDDNADYNNNEGGKDDDEKDKDDHINAKNNNNSDDDDSDTNSDKNSTNSDKNSNDRNEDKNEDGDDNNEEKNEDKEDKNDDNHVEDDEGEVTEKADDNKSIENTKHMKNRYIVESRDDGKFIIKVENTGKTEDNATIKKEKVYRFIIEVKGKDIKVGRKLEDNQDGIDIQSDTERKNNETSVDNVENNDKNESKSEVKDQGTDNDKDQDKSEHKCTNDAEKDNVTCIDDTIDYGHIFYDGPEAYMDFQL